MSEPFNQIQVVDGEVSPLSISDREGKILVELPLTNVGMRSFAEITSTYFQVPMHGLKYEYNTTHGEYHCYLSDRHAMFYLGANTSNIRWCVQYVDTAAYGANPWHAHSNLIKLLDERYSTWEYRLKEVALQYGCANISETRFPFHVKETTRMYGQC